MNLEADVYDLTHTYRVAEIYPEIKFRFNSRQSLQHLQLNTKLIHVCLISVASICDATIIIIIINSLD